MQWQESTCDREMCLISNSWIGIKHISSVSDHLLISTEGTEIGKEKRMQHNSGTRQEKTGQESILTTFIRLALRIAKIIKTVTLENPYINSYNVMLLNKGFCPQSKNIEWLLLQRLHNGLQWKIKHWDKHLPLFSSETPQLWPEMCPSQNS